MPALLFRLALVAALAFGYGPLLLPGARPASREEAGEGGARSVWSVDALGRRHGEELIYAAGGRLAVRLVWDGGTWVESTSYHANGRRAAVCTDRFPWGVMRTEEFDEEGRLVASQEW